MAKQAAKRLTDQEIVSLARKREELKKKAAKLQERSAEMQETIVKELTKRKTKAIENDGLRVTIVQNVSTVIHAELLKDKLPPASWKRITQRVLDRDKLSQAVQAGKIDLAVLEECTETKPSSPFIRVSSKGDSE